MNVKIVIQNVVRSPATRELRRANPGMVQPSPLIGGQRLPPKRSRNVDTSVLDARDFSLLADMTKCGVLKVFMASPYQQISEEVLRGMAESDSTPAPAPAPEPAPVEPEPVAEEVVVEEPAAPEPVAEIEEPVAETVAESEPEVDVDALRDELKKKKSSDLRAQLEELGGDGTGMTKAKMIAAILECLA
jgi:hypothetical protein